jgi:hypothetical protein
MLAVPLAPFAQGVVFRLCARLAYGCAPAMGCPSAMGFDGFRGSMGRVDMGPGSGALWDGVGPGHGVAVDGVVWSVGFEAGSLVRRRPKNDHWESLRRG